MLQFRFHHKEITGSFKEPPRRQVDDDWSPYFHEPGICLTLGRKLTAMSMTQTSPCCWERAPAPSLLGFSRPFVAFLGGSLVSRIGDALSTFALPWMAYELTHSSLVLGTLYATEIVPVL